MDFRIDPEACVACLACVRVCPSDAVAVENDKVWIVDETCVRAGLCLPACPHEAIIAVGDSTRALEFALSRSAVLILSVESAAYFYPATPEQVVNACYAAGFEKVHRGVLGDELVAREYLELWKEEDWGSGGTVIRSTCPVIVETIKNQYPELIPYLAPVATPIQAEARYLKALYGRETKVVYAGVCLTEGGAEVDAAITLAELESIFKKRGIKVHEQPLYFSRIPEERRRYWSTAGGLPLEILKEERQSSRRFRKVRGLGALEGIARAVGEDRIELGFVDILPCEGCLDHPLLGPREELFRRRAIVGATEPPRAAAPVLAEGVEVAVGAAFEIEVSDTAPPEDAVSDILEQIGLAPNGRPWDSGSCGYRTCREFAAAAALGRTSLKSCPRYLERQAALAQQAAAIDALTGLASFRVLRDRLANEVARCHRSGDHFAVLFLDLDNFKQVNDRFGHEAGNKVLRETAAACSAHIRSTDLAGRYGGDEFVVVLVGTGEEGALGVAEKVRAAVVDVGKAMGYPDGLVTASIGVAEYRNDRKDEDVLVAADRALYRAKAAGRNRVAGATVSGESL
ncbi:MAG TPA: diguanylate cyclase [Gemmatimonadales bacterium]|nr:diguanylate cyclase [Gemmatimonadales bacterium]